MNKSTHTTSLKNLKILTGYSTEKLLEFVEKGMLAKPLSDPNKKLCWLTKDVIDFNNILRDLECDCHFLETETPEKSLIKFKSIMLEIGKIKRESRQRMENIESLQKQGVMRPIYQIKKIVKCISKLNHNKNDQQ